MAREYGFSSWSRLVQYHAQLERQRPAAIVVHERSFFESTARSWRRELADRIPGAARSVAAYVPRFYGLPDEGRGPPPSSGLNERLCGHVRMSAPEVESLIARGADPQWVAPNGYTVLEHALLKYFNPPAIDALMTKVSPPFRDAMWVKAGVGDVAGTLAFLDPEGRPIARVREDRPPFDLFGPGPLPALPEPSDDELLYEVFVVAMLNHRLGVMEALCARGFNVNLMIMEQPLVNVAAMSGWMEIVALLERAGADLDRRGYRPAKTARESIAEREAH